ncbi:hypothetical protein OSTOST_17680 [Ostertagia ostertagi]
MEVSKDGRSVACGEGGSASAALIKLRARFVISGYKYFAYVIGCLRSFTGFNASGRPRPWPSLIVFSRCSCYSRVSADRHRTAHSTSTGQWAPICDVAMSPRASDSASPSPSTTDECISDREHTFPSTRDTLLRLLVSLLVFWCCGKTQNAIAAVRYVKRHGHTVAQEIIENSREFDDLIHMLDVEFTRPPAFLLLNQYAPEYDLQLPL